MADINDTELAELRRKAHAFDSEQGRLQKTQGELEAERAKRAELEARVAAQHAAGGQPGLDPRAAELFGTDGVAVLQTMLAPLAQVSQKLDAFGQKFAERDAAEAQARAARTFQDALSTKLAENNLPGFSGRIFGGDLSPAWNKFVEARPSIRRALAEGDVEAVSDVVATFIHQNKELVAGGFAPTAVPGFSPAVKSDYSDADYMRDTESLDRQLENLAITEEEHQKQTAACWARYEAAQRKAEQAASRFGLV